MIELVRTHRTWFNKHTGEWQYSKTIDGTETYASLEEFYTKNQHRAVKGKKIDNYLLAPVTGIDPSDAVWASAKHEEIRRGYVKVTLPDNTVINLKNGSPELTNSIVNDITCIFMDIDGHNPNQQEETENILSEMGLGYVIYSTPSYKQMDDKEGKLKYSFRVIVETDSTISKEDWKYFHMFLIEKFGVDKQTSDPSRIYLAPSHVEGSEYVWKYVEGNVLKFSEYADFINERKTQTELRTAKDRQVRRQARQEIDAAIKSGESISSLEIWKQIDYTTFSAADIARNIYRITDDNGERVNFACPLGHLHRSGSGATDAYAYYNSPNIQCAHATCDLNNPKLFLEHIREYIPSNMLYKAAPRISISVPEYRPILPPNTVPENTDTHVHLKDISEAVGDDSKHVLISAGTGGGKSTAIANDILKTLSDDSNTSKILVFAGATRTSVDEFYSTLIGSGVKEDLICKYYSGETLRTDARIVITHFTYLALMGNSDKSYAIDGFIREYKPIVHLDEIDRAISNLEKSIDLTYRYKKNLDTHVRESVRKCPVSITNKFSCENCTQCTQLGVEHKYDTYSYRKLVKMSDEMVSAYRHDSNIARTTELFHLDARSRRIAMLGFEDDYDTVPESAIDFLSQEFIKTNGTTQTVIHESKIHRFVKYDIPTGPDVTYPERSYDMFRDVLYGIIKKHAYKPYIMHNTNDFSQEYTEAFDLSYQELHRTLSSDEKLVIPSNLKDLRIRLSILGRRLKQNEDEVDRNEQVLLSHFESNVQSMFMSKIKSPPIHACNMTVLCYHDISVLNTIREHANSLRMYTASLSDGVETLLSDVFPGLKTFEIKSEYIAVENLLILTTPYEHNVYMKREGFTKEYEKMNQELLVQCDDSQKFGVSLNFLDNKEKAIDAYNDSESDSTLFMVKYKEYDMLASSSRASNCASWVSYPDSAVSRGINLGEVHNVQGSFQSFKPMFGYNYANSDSLEDVRLSDQLAKTKQMVGRIMRKPIRKHDDGRLEIIDNLPTKMMIIKGCYVDKKDSDGKVVRVDVSDVIAKELVDQLSSQVRNEIKTVHVAEGDFHSTGRAIRAIYDLRKRWLTDLDGVMGEETMDDIIEHYTYAKAKALFPSITMEKSEYESLRKDIKIRRKLEDMVKLLEQGLVPQEIRNRNISRLRNKICTEETMNLYESVVEW